MRIARPMWFRVLTLTSALVVVAATPLIGAAWALPSAAVAVWLVRESLVMIDASPERVIVRNTFRTRRVEPSAIRSWRVVGSTGLYVETNDGGIHVEAAEQKALSGRRRGRSLDRIVVDLKEAVGHA